ncbi:MAG: hypothetical protein E7164_00925 [Firmicutes bacterium]|nr:hypothetical protein [Bacillota bacterium]
MFKMNDIYMFMNERLIQNNFINLDNTDKKYVIDCALKEYLAKKIIELFSGECLLYDDIIKLSVLEMVNMIDSSLLKSMNNTEIQHLIHCVLNLVSNIQGYAIIWEESAEEKYIQTPEILYNDDGLWDRFITNRETSFTAAFNVAYEQLSNSFSLNR